MTQAHPPDFSENRDSARSKAWQSAAMAFDWIKRGLEKPGKSKTGLAAALGRNPSMVTSLLAGTRQLKADEVPIIAAYLGVAPPVDSALAEQTGIILTLSISGEVAAGVWRESGLAYDAEIADIAISTKWPAASILLLRVRGQHINRRARDGDLILCLQAEAAPRSPIPGDWVLVERRQGSLIETSVRRIVADSAGQNLLETDTDEVSLQGRFPISDGSDGGFRVVGFVLQFVKPATTF